MHILYRASVSLWTPQYKAFVLYMPFLEIGMQYVMYMWIRSKMPNVRLWLLCWLYTVILQVTDGRSNNAKCRWMGQSKLCIVKFLTCEAETWTRNVMSTFCEESTRKCLKSWKSWKISDIWKGILKSHKNSMLKFLQLLTRIFFRNWPYKE